MAVPGAAPASAQQDIRALLERMDRLERDITLVQRQLYRGQTPTPSSGAPMSGGGDLGGEAGTRLQQKLNEIESVVTGLTGQIEDVSFQVGQVRSRLDRLVIDVDYRLQQIEQRAAGAGGGASDDGPAASDVAPPSRPVPLKGGGRQTQDAVAAFGNGGHDTGGAKGDEGTLPKGSAKEQYDYIQSLLSQANHAAAEKALTSFMGAHPDDPLAGNAQYWLGETFYVRGDYRSAAVAFAKGYQKYPKSAKAASNVLKLGMSLAKLDRVQDACTAFGRLASEFPNAPGDVKQRAANERKSLGCK